RRRIERCSDEDCEANRHVRRDVGRIYTRDASEPSRVLLSYAVIVGSWSSRVTRRTYNFPHVPTLIEAQTQRAIKHAVVGKIDIQRWIDGCCVWTPNLK